MKTRKRQHKVYRCNQCGGEAPKWEGRCPVCGGWNTLQEGQAGKVSGKAEPRLEPEVQAVLERLVAAAHVERKRAAQTLRYLTARPPDGLWLSTDRLETVLHDTLVRHEENPLDNPLGYMVTLARGPERKTVASAVNRPEVGESWKAVANGGGMASLKELIANLHMGATAGDVAALNGIPCGETDSRPPADAPSNDGETCLACGDAGFVVTRRAGFEDGRLVNQQVEVCSACGNETPAERQERLLAASGLSGLQLEMRLDCLEEVDGLGPALAAVQAFLAGEVSQLVLIGGTGRGKTALAVGTLLECIERGQMGLYLNVARFLDDLRMTFENNARERYSDLMRPPLEWEVLVLDDLAGQRATDWATERLYEIVDSRYGRGLRTIACSNHSMKVWDPRIVSRLSDTRRSRVVVLETKDYRLIPRPVGVQ